MFIRPTTIIASQSIEGDLREFTHNLNQQRITDTDCIIPIWHKNQFSQIHRKDLSAGMSPWSAYQRDWLTHCELDLSYLRQGITWYRQYDDHDGVMKSYRFKGSKHHIDHYNDLLHAFASGLTCEIDHRYITLSSPSGQMIPFVSSNHIHQAISRLVGLMICYGSIQTSGDACIALKVTLAVSPTTRTQLSYLVDDIGLLANHGLFISYFLSGAGIQQTLELHTNDVELIDLLVPHLQIIDSRVVMSTVDILQSRSAQLTQTIQGYIAKPRQLT